MMRVYCTVCTGSICDVARTNVGDRLTLGGASCTFAIGFGLRSLGLEGLVGVQGLKVRGEPPFQQGMNDLLTVVAEVL